MGYRPNPLVAAFQAQLRSRRPSLSQPTIGWIDDQADPRFWSEHEEFKAARRRAEKLGYSIDIVRLDNIKSNDPSGTAARFQRILAARGILGIVLPCLHRAHLVGERWPDLAVVSLGKNSGSLRGAKVRHSDWTLFNEVGPDTAANIQLALTTLRERGYRRIGLAIGDFHSRMSESIPLAVMLHQNTILPTCQRVPPILLPMPGDPAKSFGLFQKWWTKHRPDAVLVSHLEVPGWCRKMGLRIPRDVAIAHIERDVEDQEVSGIDPARAMQAEAAIDLVSAHLIRNDRDAPSIPVRALIRGSWVDTGTVVERSKAVSRRPVKAAPR